jgi:hypothetical protein
MNSVAVDTCDQAAQVLDLFGQGERLPDTGFARHGQVEVEGGNLLGVSRSRWAGNLAKLHRSKRSSTGCSQAAILVAVESGRFGLACVRPRCSVMRRK